MHVAAPAAADQFREEHLAALRTGLPWERATLALHFAALKQFLRWTQHPLVERKGLWRLPSGETSHRRWLTKPQLLALYDAARGRERVLIALEGFNGLRRVELLRLQCRDIVRAEESLRIRGKGRFGGKWRQVPLHPVVQSVLARATRGMGPDDRVLPLSMSGADAVLQRAARRAGFAAIGVKVSHHDLRRTFGRLAHEAGMDLVQLKNLFGHSSIDMTVHYIGLDATRMREGLLRLNRSLAARQPGSRLSPLRRRPRRVAR